MTVKEKVNQFLQARLQKLRSIYYTPVNLTQGQRNTMDIASGLATGVAKGVPGEQFLLNKMRVSVPKPTTLGGKISQFVGENAPMVALTAGIGSALKGVKGVQLAQKPLLQTSQRLIAKGGATKLLGQGLAGMTKGIPTTLGYEAYRNLAQRQSIGQSGKSIAGNLAFDLATGPLPIIGVGGMVVGKNALNYANLPKLTKTLDNLPKAEISDLSASLAKNWDTIISKLKNQGETPVIADVLNHETLFKNYPILKNMKIDIDPSLKGIDGFFDPNTNSIKLSAGLTREKFRSTLLHEVQHSIQQIEDFAKGQNLKNGKGSYLKSAGELEARSTQLREGMTAEQRKVINPYDQILSKEGINRGDVIVNKDNRISQSTKVPKEVVEKSKQLESAKELLEKAPKSNQTYQPYSVPSRIPNVSESNLLPDQLKVQKNRILPEQVGKSNTQKQQVVKEEIQQLTRGDDQINKIISASSENIIPQEVDPVQKVISALRGAKPLVSDQSKIYSELRSKQAGAIAGIGKNIPGEAGFHAQLGQLKGEMPKVSFESIRNQIKQTDIDMLFNKVEQSNLTPFEKITAKSGLAKILGEKGGTVPQRGEIDLLNEVFPPEFIQEVMNKRPLMEKLFSIGASALNLPRSIMATADLSAPLRQGIFLAGRPKQWLPAFRDMFKYFASDKAYKGLNESIKARPTYQAMRESKLALTDMSPVLTSREEVFMSNLTSKVPLFGKLADASNRAYSGFLNKLRADVFDDLLSKAKDLGISKERPGVANDIASFVNSATGRGEYRGGLKSLNKASVVLNSVFFSPRLMASRLNLLDPTFYVSLDPFVRKEALKSLFTFAGTGLTLLGLAKLNGAQVGTDPRSADFGKIKVGDTRFDTWGGFQQYIVLASRLLTGQMVSSTTGKEIQLGQGYKPITRQDIIQNFFESKTSPVASFILSLLKGQTALGEPTNIPVEIIDRFLPMMASDMYDLYREQGPKGILMEIPGIFGVGTQTYADQIPMNGKTATGKPNIQWRQPPSLGETILNKVTGTQVSDIPQNQWAPLYAEKQAKALRTIEITKAKSVVLETGQPQTVGNTLIYLDKGVVKTKEITPAVPTPPKTSSKKSSFRKVKTTSKIAFKKAKIRKLAAIKLKASSKKMKSIAWAQPKLKAPVGVDLESLRHPKIG